MLVRLLPEVERRLRAKCLSVLCYYRPGYDEGPEGVKLAQFGRLSEELERERGLVRSGQQRHEEYRRVREKMSAAYLTVRGSVCVCVCESVCVCVRECVCV
uniref:Uncharacterized protein n=1 Tax=Callorhinchus milii TaxID=7868 RepID=A0A4W3GU20_CALMI